MKRAFLIKPRWDYPHTKGDFSYNRIWFPLSLAYCASIIRKCGLDVVLYDFHGMRGLDMSKELSRIKAEDIVFITSSDIDKWQCPQIDLAPVLRTVEAAKQRTDNIFIIGPHGTMNPELMLRLTGAKAVIRGEPECAVVELATEMDIGNVRGISFKRNGVVIHAPDSLDVDMDALPFPDLSLLKKVDYRYEIVGNRLAVIEASRNCPSQCTFCNKSMYGTRYRLKSIKRVMEEIKAGMRHGARRGKFVDLNIGTDKSYLRRLCHAIIEEVPGFEWCCQARIDSADDELIPLMVRAGCRLIDFGVESGMQDRLDCLGKGLDLEKVKHILQLCKKHKLPTLCFFMMGLPDETLQEAKRTLDYAFDINSTYASFHILTYFKGTEIFDAGQEKEGFSYVEPDTEKLRLLERMRKRAHRKYYLRFRYLKENLSTVLAHTPLPRFRFFLSYLN